MLVMPDIRKEPRNGISKPAYWSGASAQLVGDTDGLDDGLDVGAADGEVVGDREGLLVGNDVGRFVGAGEVGSFVGQRVGGACVGQRIPSRRDSLRLPPSPIISSPSWLALCSLPCTSSLGRISSNATSASRHIA